MRIIIMNSQPTLPLEPTASSQIRVWTRFLPDTPEMVVIVGDARNRASLLDESFGGIGITIEMEDSVDVQVGEHLIVLHYDCPTPAQVQWIERNHEAGQIRLGIRWSC
jgi:hypothetical protein